MARREHLPRWLARPHLRRERGLIFILTVAIMVVLTGLALIFTRQARVELLASDNIMSTSQADATVKGAARHVLNRLVNNQDRTTLDQEVQSQNITLGDGVYWIMRPNPDDEKQYAYGVIDEASKLNINTATLDMLLKLPGMTPELAASIIDWRDADDTPTEGGGGESSYYLTLPDPYYCKNGPFETLDELLLVKGATRDVLFGIDLNRNGVVDATEAAGTENALNGFNGQAQCGVCKYLTLYSAEANTTQNGQPRTFVGDTRPQTLFAIQALLRRSLSAARATAVVEKLRTLPPAANVLDFYRISGLTSDEFKKVSDLITTDRGRVVRGKINVNTAPKEVLACLPGLEQADVDQLITARTGTGTDLTNLAWVAAALAPDKAAKIGGQITTRSYQFSADIVGVSTNGRGFKRCYYVFDLRLSPARILFRKDLTYLGWPLNPALKGIPQGVPPTSSLGTGGM